MAVTEDNGFGFQGFWKYGGVCGGGVGWGVEVPHPNSKSTSEILTPKPAYLVFLVITFFFKRLVEKP